MNNSYAKTLKRAFWYKELGDRLGGLGPFVIFYITRRIVWYGALHKAGNDVLALLSENQLLRDVAEEFREWQKEPEKRDLAKATSALAALDAYDKTVTNQEALKALQDQQF